MRTLIISGFLLVVLVLAWLGFNQQETNSYLRALVVENRKLTEALTNATQVAHTAQAAPVLRPVPEGQVSPNPTPGNSLSFTRPAGRLPGGLRRPFRPQ